MKLLSYLKSLFRGTCARLFTKPSMAVEYLAELLFEYPEKFEVIVKDEPDAVYIRLNPEKAKDHLIHITWCPEIRLQPNDMTMVFPNQPYPIELTTIEKMRLLPAVRFFVGG